MAVIAAQTLALVARCSDQGTDPSVLGPPVTALLTEPLRGVLNRLHAAALHRSNAASFVDGWQQLSVDFTVPAGATEAFLRVYNGQPTGTGKVVYWDNLSVRELVAPFGPQWSSGAGGGPAAVTYTGLEFPAADVVKVNDASGGYFTFGKSTSGTFFPQPGAEDLS